jgi:hypothetical protein
MQDIDMKLEDNNIDDAHAADFHSDNPMPNIWTLDSEESTDSDTSSEDHDNQAVVSNHDEDELEKPSFLRRFKKNRKNEKPEETSEPQENDEKSE